jgi:hypothetical protein
VPPATSTQFAQRALRNIRPGARGSLRLDAGELDHLGPFLGFVGNELAEIGRRARKHCAAEVNEPRFHVGIGEGCVDLRVELRDDFGRRVLGRADPVPETRFVARQELTHGRDVWQRVRARRSGYSERTQPASPDIGGRSTNPEWSLL